MDNIEKGRLGEQFVFDLASQSFLKYWCFPNPLDENGDKKELCDLIIHFHDVIFLFCVKNYEFKGKYERYFRKTIEKDVRQLWGAEKKILTSVEGVVVKHLDGRTHSIIPSSIKSIHRLIIHLGDNVHFYPFNKKTKAEKYIHVLDKMSFNNIISYLDTIKDFEKYLRDREAAFRDKTTVILPSQEEQFDSQTGLQFFQYMAEMKGNVKSAWDNRTVMISGNESDLLASYIQNGRRFDSKLIGSNYTDFLLQIDNEWQSFLLKHPVQNKFNEDKVSYFIDEFVKKEVLVNPGELHAELAKELLSFDRYERRLLAKAILSLVDEHKNKSGLFLGRRYLNIDDVAIILVYYTENIPSEHLNNLLTVVLDTYAVYSNYKYKKTILLAATKNFKQIKSGLQYLNEPFDTEYENQVKKNIALLKWFTNTTNISFTEEEFPE